MPTMCISCLGHGVKRAFVITTFICDYCCPCTRPIYGKTWRQDLEDWHFMLTGLHPPCCWQENWRDEDFSGEPIWSTGDLGHWDGSHKADWKTRWAQRTGSRWARTHTWWASKWLMETRNDPLVQSVGCSPWEADPALPFPWASVSAWQVA